MVKKLRHIGIMGEDFDRMVKKFEGFGLPCTEVVEIKPIGEVMLELITHTEPDRKEDPVTSLVRAHPGSINHLCFEVDDLEASIRDFESAGARLVEGSVRPGAHGRVAFFYPETTEGVLIELCEV